MNTIMKKAGVLASATLALALPFAPGAPAALASVRPAAVHAAPPVHWLTSLEDAQQAARITGQPILVDFSAGWCPWCQKMDAETYTNPEVRRLARNYICVKVDTDSAYGQALMQKYGVTSVPTILFFDSSGNSLGMVNGYEDAATFAPQMDQYS